MTGLGILGELEEWKRNNNRRGELVFRARAAGFSVATIAKAIGVNRNTIYVIINEEADARIAMNSTELAGTCRSCGHPIRWKETETTKFQWVHDRAQICQGAEPTITADLLRTVAQLQLGTAPVEDFESEALGLRILNPEPLPPGDTITTTLKNMQKYFGAQDKTVVFVTIDNDIVGDLATGTQSLSQRQWVSMLNEVNYVLELFEITGHKLTGITVWHSPPDANVQSVAWSLTVQNDRVEALRDRLFSLVTRPPYELVNGPGVLVARTA